MNTIAEKWKIYEKNVVPKNAERIQLQETKRAFYAGAASVLSIGFKIGKENMSDEVGAMLIADLDVEVRMFVDSLRKGEA